MDLEKVIKKCLKQNPKAQKALYDFLSAKLYAVCLRYAHNSEDAKEFLQLGAIKVFQNLEKYKQGTAFLPWAKKVTVNEILNTFRKKNALDMSQDIDDSFDISGDTAATIESQFTLQELRTMISSLPEKKKIVFNLYVIEGYNHQEIGDLMGISEGTSKSQLAKAKAMIKELINKTEQVA